MSVPSEPIKLVISILKSACHNNNNIVMKMRLGVIFFSWVSRYDGNVDDYNEGDDIKIKKLSWFCPQEADIHHSEAPPLNVSTVIFPEMKKISFHNYATFQESLHVCRFIALLAGNTQRQYCCWCMYPPASWAFVDLSFTG